MKNLIAFVVMFIVFFATLIFTHLFFWFAFWIFNVPPQYLFWILVFDFTVASYAVAEFKETV